MVNGLYLELLDGEYLKIASGQSVIVADSVRNSVERYLKIMALFGYKAILSDVQVIDSGLWLDLFDDPSFRYFLTNCEGFVSLRSKSLDDSGSPEYSLTVAGLNRALDPMWISSAFIDTDLVRLFAELILKRGESILEVDFGKKKGVPDELRKTIQEAKHPNDRRRLPLLLRSLLFFMSRPKLVGESVGLKQTYYSILEKAVAADYEPVRGEPLTNAQLSVVTRLLAHIKEKVDEEKDWGKRSALRATLDTKKWPQTDQEMWNTSVHAWNCAIRDSIGAEGIVLGSLNNGIHIGLSNDPIDNALYPLSVSEHDEKSRLQKVLPKSTTCLQGISRDPQDLTWVELGDIVSKTGHTRMQLVEARDIWQDNYLEWYKQHIGAVAEHMTAQVPNLPAETRTILALAGGIVVLIGWPLGSAALSIAGAAAALPKLLNTVQKKWIASCLRKSHEKFKKGLITGGKQKPI